MLFYNILFLLLVIVIVIIIIFVLKNKNISIDEIDKIYKKNSGYILNLSKNENNGNNYPLTYGEITYDALKNIKNKFSTKDTFIDLGCGTGRSLVYALITGFNNAKGIEFVETRVQSGKKSISEIQQKKLQINLNNLKIEQGDLFSLDNSYFPDNSIVFISNLMFSDDLNNKIMDFFDTKISSKNIVLIISKKINKTSKTFVLDENLLSTPMSWDVNSKCYVYLKN